jgi:hypothetical protein
MTYVKDSTTYRGTYTSTPPQTWYRKQLQEWDEHGRASKSHNESFRSSVGARKPISFYRTGLWSLPKPASRSAAHLRASETPPEETPGSLRLELQDHDSSLSARRTHLLWMNIGAPQDRTNHHFTIIKLRHVALNHWDQYMYMVQRAERAVNE